MKSGETKTVTFIVKAESLAWWNDNILGWEVEGGPVHVLIGSSSQEVLKQQKTFTVIK